jgi:hypothetical protein
VKVIIRKEVTHKVDCLRYDDGLHLETQQLDFDPSNFDVPRTVTINVMRKMNTFQGNSLAWFNHTIETEDSDWKSLFLRSVSVALIDDSPCVDGAQKMDDLAVGVRKCGCSKDFWIGAVDDDFCESAVECMPCPKGMLCESQQYLQTAALEAGWYASVEHTIRSKRCC